MCMRTDELMTKNIKKPEKYGKSVYQDDYGRYKADGYNQALSDYAAYHNQEIEAKDKEIAELKKHNCEDWVNEGRGCSICCNSMIYSLDEWKKVQEHVDARIAEQEGEIAELKAKIAGLREALGNIMDIIDNSQGLCGWHLNGDIAYWGEFSDLLEEAHQAIADRIRGWR